MTDTITITAGIDTSKGKLDLAVHGHPGSLTVDNARPGWKTAAEQLRRASVTRVGIEATGGYERGILRYLQQAAFEVVLLQPLRCRWAGAAVPLGTAPPPAQLGGRNSTRQLP